MVPNAWAKYFIFIVCCRVVLIELQTVTQLRNQLVLHGQLSVVDCKDENESNTLTEDSSSLERQ